MSTLRTGFLTSAGISGIPLNKIDELHDSLTFPDSKLAFLIVRLIGKLQALAHTRGNV